MESTLSRRTYTVEETAALLGIGRRQAYEAIAAGCIRAIRLGRSYRIPREWLDDVTAGRRSLEEC